MQVLRCSLARTMLFSLTVNEKTYSTIDGAIFRALQDYLEKGIISYQYLEEIAAALITLSLEEKYLALRKQQEEEKKTARPAWKLH
jgi:hypothetical protein